MGKMWKRENICVHMLGQMDAYIAFSMFSLYVLYYIQPNKTGNRIHNS